LIIDNSLGACWDSWDGWDVWITHKVYHAHPWPNISDLNPRP
jgi:hypothetical protein